MRNAIVVGSTGLIGSYLIRFLNENENYKHIYALVRREGSIDETLLKGGKVLERVINFDELDFSGIEASDIYCALGTTMKIAGSKEKFYRVDHDYVINASIEGKSIGAKSFAMVSSIGANHNSGTFYLKVKGETERDLLDKGYDKTIIFRPSLLLGPRKEKRTMEKFGEVMLKIFRPIMVGALRTQVPVHASQVAAAMIDKMLNSEEQQQIVGSNAIREYSVTEDE